MRACDKHTKFVVLGATGRLGTMLQREAQRAQLGAHFIWQTRTVPGPNGAWVQWDPEDRSNTEISSAKRLATAIEHAAEGNKLVILNLAGAVPSPKISNDAMNRANVLLAECVLDAATFLNSERVLFASSAAIYGPANPNHAPFREDDIPAAIAPYGLSKVAMERSVLARKSNASILRIGNVAGADALLGQMIAPKQSRPIRFTLDQFDSGNGPMRSYIGPKSFFRAIWALTGLTHDIPNIVNISGPTPVTMNALLDSWNRARPNEILYDFRPAQKEAIETVTLATERLRTIMADHNMPFADMNADTIVSEVIEHYFEG